MLALFENKTTIWLQRAADAVAPMLLVSDVASLAEAVDDRACIRA